MVEGLCLNFSWLLDKNEKCSIPIAANPVSDVPQPIYIQTVLKKKKNILIILSTQTKENIGLIVIMDFCISNYVYIYQMICAYVNFNADIPVLHFNLLLQPTNRNI